MIIQLSHPCILGFYWTEWLAISCICYVASNWGAFDSSFIYLFIFAKAHFTYGHMLPILECLTQMQSVMLWLSCSPRQNIILFGKIKYLLLVNWSFNVNYSLKNREKMRLQWRYSTKRGKKLNNNVSPSEICTFLRYLWTCCILVSGLIQLEGMSCVWLSWSPLQV